MGNEEWVRAELKRMGLHHKELCKIACVKGDMISNARYVALGRISALEDILKED